MFDEHSFSNLSKDQLSNREYLGLQDDGDEYMIDLSDKKNHLALTMFLASDVISLTMYNFMPFVPSIINLVLIGVMAELASYGILMAASLPPVAIIYKFPRLNFYTICDCLEDRVKQYNMVVDRIRLLNSVQSHTSTYQSRAFINYLNWMTFNAAGYMMYSKIMSLLNDINYSQLGFCGILKHIQENRVATVIRVDEFNMLKVEGAKFGGLVLYLGPTKKLTSVSIPQNSDIALEDNFWFRQLDKFTTFYKTDRSNGDLVEVFLADKALEYLKNSLDNLGENVTSEVFDFKYKISFLILNPQLFPLAMEKAGFEYYETKDFEKIIKMKCISEDESENEDKRKYDYIVDYIEFVQVSDNENDLASANKLVDVVFKINSSFLKRVPKDGIFLVYKNRKISDNDMVYYFSDFISIGRYYQLLSYFIITPYVYMNGFFKYLNKKEEEEEQEQQQVEEENIKKSYYFYPCLFTDDNELFIEYLQFINKLPLGKETYICKEENIDIQETFHSHKFI